MKTQTITNPKQAKQMSTENEHKFLDKIKANKDKIVQKYTKFKQDHPTVSKVMNIAIPIAATLIAGPTGTICVGAISKIITSLKQTIPPEFSNDFDAASEYLAKNSENEGIKEKMNVFLRDMMKEKEWKGTEIFQEIVKGQQHILTELIQSTEQIKDQFPGLFISLNSIQATMGNIQNGVDQINEKLDDFQEDYTDQMNRLIQKNLAEYSEEEIFAISKEQIETVQLRSKMDIPFDPNLFIPDEELDEQFEKFNADQQRSIFLILANIGMGKTWNSVHLGLRTLLEKRTNFVFFIPLRDGFTDKLKQIFGKENEVLYLQIGNTAKKIYENTKKRVEIIFDGFDEMMDTNLHPIFLSLIVNLCRKFDRYIKIILTSRIYNWLSNDEVMKQYGNINQFILEHPAWTNKIHQNFSPKVDVSWYFEGFSDSQRNLAIQKYGLERNRFSTELLELCKRPYVLQIIKDRNEYFDPKDGEKFSKIFNSNQGKSIAYRMELISTAWDYFMNILLKFPDLKGEVPADIIPIDQRESKNYIRVMCSGVLILDQKGEQGVASCYKIDEIFIPCLTYLTSQINQRKNEEEFTAKLDEKIELKYLKYNKEKIPPQHRYEYLANKLKQSPPVKFLWIYKLSQVFGEEMKQFFIHEEHHALILKYINESSLENLDQIEKYIDAWMGDFELLREGKWKRTSQDLIQMYNELFNLNDDISKAVIKSNFNGNLRFIDTKYNIEAKSETELKNLYNQKKIEESTSENQQRNQILNLNRQYFEYLMSLVPTADLFFVLDRKKKKYSLKLEGKQSDLIKVALDSNFPLDDMLYSVKKSLILDEIKSNHIPINIDVDEEQLIESLLGYMSKTKISFDEKRSKRTQTSSNEDINEVLSQQQQTEEAEEEFEDEIVKQEIQEETQTTQQPETEALCEDAESAENNEVEIRKSKKSKKITKPEQILLKMPLAELREECSIRNIPHSGNKEILVQRLVENLQDWESILEIPNSFILSESCEALGLEISNVKEELIHEIIEFFFPETRKVRREKESKSAQKIAISDKNLLFTLNQDELKEICKQWKLYRTGSKGTLIDYILALNSEIPDILKKVTLPKLRQFLRRREIDEEGEKDELVIRLYDQMLNKLMDN